MNSPPAFIGYSVPNRSRRQSRPPRNPKYHQKMAWALL